ncbi:hypothetical protein EB118_16685 [bacterium]|nr:hypothetical protein [bacterium]
MALQPVATTLNLGQDKIFNLAISETAPIEAVPGTFAVADGTIWDPVSKFLGKPYPVFYDGVRWQSLY